MKKHNQSSPQEFGEWRTGKDFTIWALNRLPRYDYASRLLNHSHSVEIKSCVDQAKRSRQNIYFHKKVDEKPIGKFVFLGGETRLGEEAITMDWVYEIPRPGSNEWRNAESLTREHYAAAIDPKKDKIARLESALKCHMIFSAWAPYRRGSSTTALVLLSHMLKSIGLALPPQREGVDLNVHAICTEFPTFFIQCIAGDYFESARGPHEMAHISKQIQRYNDVYNHLNDKGIVWQELIYALHQAANSGEPPSLRNYEAIDHMTRLADDNPLRLTLVQFTSMLPGLRIDTREAYERVHMLARTSIKVPEHPTALPQEFPCYIEMSGREMPGHLVVSEGPMPSVNLEFWHEMVMDWARLRMNEECRAQTKN